MKRGMTIVELLVAVVVLGAICLASLPLFTAVVKDIPRDGRAIDAHAELGRMLRQMRKDVDAATGLPAGLPVREAGGNPLSVFHADGVVLYEMRPGRVVRSTKARGGKAMDGEKCVWPVPRAVIQWGVRQRGGEAYAVEVRTGVEIDQEGRTFRKLANAHVFFVGAAGRGRGK